jgi:hypothetical protein
MNTLIIQSSDTGRDVFQYRCQQPSAWFHDVSSDDWNSARVDSRWTMTNIRWHQWAVAEEHNATLRKLWGETWFLVLVPWQAPKAAALEAKSISKNLLSSMNIHACINVADAQLFIYIRSNKRQLTIRDLVLFVFFSLLSWQHANSTALLHTLFNITEGLQFNVCIFKPNYVSVRIWK